MGITNVIQTNEIIKNYYEVLSNIRSELINRIKEIIKEDVEIYDTSEEIDDEYYELPTFYTINKYNQQDTYSIVKITKDLEIISMYPSNISFYNHRSVGRFLSLMVLSLH